MTEAPELSPEQFEAAFQLVFSRRDLWSQAPGQTGHKLLLDTATKLAGELSVETLRDIVAAVSRELDDQLTADPEYGRRVRRYLWSGDQEGYANYLNAMYSARIPALVEWALQSLSVPILASESEKLPRWIQ